MYVSNNVALEYFYVPGNLMVIFVVTFSRRLRSITNFFLANLAVADFCVGIFCVYQTLTNYLMNSWQLGDFLCKVYMFVHALSYTASILILVVVCTERYLAIVHPIKCRSMLTRKRLRIVIGIVWILAAVYASPRFFYVETISNRLNNGDVDIICIANIKKHNNNVLDVVNLVFLYLLPLFLMCCLYTRIAIGLWRSSVTLGGPGLVAKTKNGRVHHHVHTSSMSKNVLKARRGVIRTCHAELLNSSEWRLSMVANVSPLFSRMLIAVVTMFAVCNLPQQARILWRHWGSSYDHTSDFSTLLTVSTFLISYMNSCLNPLLYAFLSRNFRKGMRELLHCRGTRNDGGALAMCASGDHNRHENGVSTHLPQSSVIRLNSIQNSLSTTRPIITRQNTYARRT
ncbi:Allatostatin-A receptor [Temnothorax longispinosus]|uniref:Allatostatin-A receptor n=1 Tax=Temnothorax longispinosus TaxID=300112 RepID=A0A4S2KAX4_9HYME|nr:Allatostatin-A receptor [Temnothorax longispinosus]